MLSIASQKKQPNIHLMNCHMQFISLAHRLQFFLSFKIISFFQVISCRRRRRRYGGFHCFELAHTQFDSYYTLAIMAISRRHLETSTWNYMIRKYYFPSNRITTKIGFVKWIVSSCFTMMVCFHLHWGPNNVAHFNCESFHYH